MAFGINDEEVSTGFGANDRVVGGFGVNDVVVSKPSMAAPKPTPQQIERMAAKPEVDLTKPAFAAPRQRATELQKVQAAAVQERAKPEPPKIDYKELYTNPDLFNIVKNYTKAATGTEYKEGQDKEKFVQGFMTNLRGQEWNTFSNIAALNKLKNAPMSDREKLAAGTRLFDQVKSATEEGGQPGMAPYLDIAQSALTDLTNYLGFGVATGLKKAAAKKATEAVTSSLLKPAAITAATMGTEAVVGAGQNVAEQKKQQAVSTALGQTPKDLDPTQIGVAALVSSIGGFFEAKGALAVPEGKTGAEQLTDILKKKQAVPKDPNAPITSTERVLIDPVTENMDKVVEDFIKIEGRRILDEVNPATALTDAKVQKDMSARAVRVAMHVIDQDPTFRLKPNQQVSSAINEVFSNLDNVNDAVLEQAIRKEGLTPDDFAKANKMTVSEAAQVMQQYSAASKVLKRMTEIDPVIKQQVDELFAKPDSQVTALGRVGQAIRFAERESKAFIVSGIGTTVRNVLGTSVGLTYNSAASLIEGALYTVGRTLDGAAKGQRLTTAMRSLGDTMSDAFSVYGYMAKGGLSTEVTNTLLQHNPALRNNILSATQESSTTELSKAAQVFNTLNVAQDAFFRKAIFNAAVEKHMRRAGLDMYETIGQGKSIPASILQQATDETLKATFSYTPKVQKQGIQTFEAGAEAAGNLFVKAAEFPGGSLIATFPRFMSNAIAFQYRYSVFGAASGMEDLLQGSLLKAAGSSGGDALIRKGQENIAKGVVGTAALAAAYDYRMNNQDTDWYNMKQDDGSTVDTRSVFPLGPTLAVADFMAKRKLGLEPKTAEMVEAIVGMKMPAGTQNQFLDQLFAAMSSEKEADKIEIAAGKVLGDFVARFSQPFVFKSAYEFLDLFREGGAIQRDPNVITAEDSGDRFIEAAVNRVQGKLPVLKEQLPEAIPRLREGPVYKEGEFFYSLVGVRETPPKTVSEKEIVRLGIDPFKLYGPSSGDRTYDRAFVEAANPLVINAIERTIANKRYQALTPTEQKLALTNVVRDVTSIARDKTDGKFMSEDLLRVKKMQFDKLSQDQRKVINERYARDNDGVTLEEAKDYKAVDKYEAMLGNLAFAKGGFVGKVLGKKAADEAAEPILETLKKKSVTPTPADNAAIDDIINKRVGTETTSSAAIDQTANMLMGKKPVLPKSAAKSKPVLPKAAAEPAAIAPEAPVLGQTEQALPTPPAKTIEAPTPSKQTDEFDDIDYETQMYNEDPTLNMSYSFDDLPYADPSIAGKGVVGTPIDKFTSIGGIDGAINIVRKERTDAFDKLRGDPDFLDFDDSVLSTALAKYREKDSARMSELMNLPKERVSPFYAPEFDIEKANTDQFNTFFKIAKSEQKRLDDLRSRYKDRPPVTLFHGQEEGTKVMQNLVKKGFTSPQTDPRKHAEMTLGAPSFTKDPNLNVLIPKFGGEDVGAYGAVNFPYADYLYRRVNMPAKTYDLANKGRGGDPLEALSVYNRAISGTDDNAVPISLPKSYHLESEDMFIEADKLKKMGFERPASKKGDVEARDQITKAISEKDLTTTNLKKLGDSYETFKKGIENKRVSEKDIYKMYGDVRNLFKQELSRSTKTVSVTGGAGSRYVNTIRTLAEGDDLTVPFRDLPKGMSIVDVLTDLEKEMSKLAKRKGNTVLTEKAANIAEMKDLLSGIREQTVNKFGSVTPSSVKAAGYSKGKIPESKMGLATSVKDLQEKKKKLVEKVSREWEEDVIDNLKNQIENIDADIAAKKEAIGPLQSERSLKDQVMKLTDKFAKGGLASRR